VPVAFSYDDEPTVNSQDKLIVAISGSHNLRRRSKGECNHEMPGLPYPAFRMVNAAGWRRAAFQALRFFGDLLERYFNFGIAARFGLGHCLGNPVKMQPHNPPCGVPQYNNGDFAAR
jgi:hypothetical protein